MFWSIPMICIYPPRNEHVRPWVPENHRLKSAVWGWGYPTGSLQGNSLTPYESFQRSLATGKVQQWNPLISEFFKSWSQVTNKLWKYDYIQPDVINHHDSRKSADESCKVGMPTNGNETRWQQHKNITTLHAYCWRDDTLMTWNDHPYLWAFGSRPLRAECFFLLYHDWSTNPPPRYAPPRKSPALGSGLMKIISFP